METYIYIVSSYAMSDGCITCDEVLAFNNYDDALTQFNIIVDETKVEVENSNWESEHSEIGKAQYFCAWEDGEFSLNRCEITLREIVLM